jgi:uncharacterized protein YndB with AHSA1/START domain
MCIFSKKNIYREETAMTAAPRSDRETNRLERTVEATPEQIWELWTTPAGIESWWAPEGFAVQVQTLEARPGGELVYTMTATGAEQIAFMEQAGMPLATESRKTFTEVDAPTRLAYNSLVDFVPGVESYEFLTVVELRPTASGVSLVMTVDAMHDDEWTQRLLAGRANELDNLAAVVERRNAG